METADNKNFQEIIDSVGFDYELLAVSLDGGGFKLLDLEISPLEFLKQAEADFVSSGDALYLNCITNCKRAIIAQMDQILYSFGFEPFRWNIVKKMKVLNELGVLTPAVLRKVSKLRNLLEHSYSKPTRDEVELALDIANLFVLSNKALFNIYCSELIFRMESDEVDIDSFNIFNGLSIGLNREKHTVYWQVFVYKEGEWVSKYKLYNSDPFFYNLVRLCAAMQLDYKVDEAFSLLNQTCKKYKS